MTTRVAFVAGSSKGLGAAIAEAFGKLGYHVVVSYRTDRAGAERVAASVTGVGASATVTPLDVTDEDSVREAYSLVDSLGRLDALVVTAVREIPKAVDQATLDEWHTVLHAKLDGAFLMTKHAIPLMGRSDNPSITYVTSIDGERPSGEFIAYQTGTAGLIAFTKANSVYLARKYGIRCNAISPGPVRTPLWDQLGGEDESMWERFARSSPVKRIAAVEDVAAACLFLATDPQRFLNGVFLSVDGGDQWT